jgi:4-hydroxythreonine-4-phosphate dehydrogenase
MQTEPPLKPLIAVTQGDPTGIGPEVIAAAWSNSELHERSRPLVLGHPQLIRRAIALRKLDLDVVEIQHPSAADPSPGSIPCLPVLTPGVLDLEPARVDPCGGQAAYDALRLGVEYALACEVDALTTAPLNKAALNAAGHHYPGHTELLGHLCHVPEVAMMLYLAAGPPLAGPHGLGVVHVTLHASLRDSCRDLSTEKILSCCLLAQTALVRLGAPRPRIGVCALNPHAGEDGLFGDEEQTIIRPAVEAARRKGLVLEGPLPTDTLMVRARDGEFDAVVAMYHDQGHIALKLLAMHRAVNITLGLPIIRTSVAHGTAFDLAWQGRADHRGMVEAIGVAAQLARLRFGQNATSAG